MGEFATNELLLIRHAPVAEAGRLCGRTDPPARVGEVAALRERLAGVGQVVTSPALRCRQTAEALWPGRAIAEDARLWEQDFGRFDGASLGDLPDLGPLPLSDLAAWRYPEGESFLDMAARVRDVIEAPVEGPLALVAHAGTVRAALGLALGDVARGLAFEIAPLSLTRLRRYEGGFSIVQTNWTA